MQENIHPQYQQIKVTCSCGNKFETGSTYKKPDLRIEICAKCHPFYTGQQKLIDTAGRIDRFRQKYEAPKKAVVPQEAAPAVKAAVKQKAVPAVKKAKSAAKAKK